MNWASKTCDKCGDVDGHGPSIGIGVGALLVVGGLAISMRKKIMSLDTFRYVETIKSVGKVKIKLLLFICQARVDKAQSPSLHYSLRGTCLPVLLALLGYLRVCSDYGFYDG